MLSPLIQEVKLSIAEIKWLMVFDNVEDRNLLDRIWPSCGQGSILITCRSELLAASSAASAIEVPSFTDEEGGALLLQELGLDHYSAHDLELSASFSNTLGGHGLAIDLMARHMSARKKTLDQLIQSYREDPRSLHSLPKRGGIVSKYYSKDLSSMWTIAFDQLEPTSARLFGILSMVGPDQLPTQVLVGAMALFTERRYSLNWFVNSAPSLTVHVLMNTLGLRRGFSSLWI